MCRKKVKFESKNSLSTSKIYTFQSSINSPSNVKLMLHFASFWAMKVNFERIFCFIVLYFCNLCKLESARIRLTWIQKVKLPIKCLTHTWTWWLRNRKHFWVGVEGNAMDCTLQELHLKTLDNKLVFMVFTLPFFI